MNTIEKISKKVAAKWTFICFDDCSKKRSMKSGFLCGKRFRNSQIVVGIPTLSMVE